MTGYKRFFGLKELEIKMSSVKPFSFNAVELCVVTINEKAWTRVREVCRALEFGKATKAADIVKHLCSRENYAHKWQLTELFFETNSMDWPKDSRKDDYYINEEGMYEIVFSRQQPKAKDFRRHYCNMLLPHVRQQLTNRMKEDHQQAIEEKDAAIALLNDDLKIREHDNVALQAQRDVYKEQLQKCQDIITHLKTLHVPYSKDPAKDNNVMIILRIATLKSFMSIPTILQEYNDGLFPQKNDGLRYNIHVIGS